MISNSIHLEPAYGQFYTEYDPQIHQPGTEYPQQYNIDVPNTQKSTIRDIETAYQYHVGYDQPIQQPLQQNPHYNVKSPYHINPAYDDPYIPHENLSSQQRNEPIVTSSQHPAAEYPDVYLSPYRENPKNYLWLSVLVCLINPFFGLIAIAYSVSSAKAKSNARIKKAKVHGRLALTNSLLGILLTVVGTAIFLLVFLV